MKLVSFPYYYDLEGQVINGVMIQPQHVKLFGLISVLEQGQYGCIASTEYLAEVLRTSQTMIMNKRADLARAGLIKLIKRKGSTEIEEIKTVRLSLDSAINQQGNSLYRMSRLTLQDESTHSTEGVGNREATPVGNNNINNSSIAAHADSSANAASSATAADTKNRTSSFPFDEKVDEVVSLKPTGARREDKRAFAIASQVYKKMGLDAKPGVKMRDRIKRRLSEGYTQEDILGCVAWCEKDQFYGSNKSPMVWTSEEAMAQYKMGQAREQEVAKANKKEVRFKSTW